MTHGSSVNISKIAAYFTSKLGNGNKMKNFEDIWFIFRHNAFFRVQLCHIQQKNHASLSNMTEV